MYYRLYTIHHILYDMGSFLGGFQVSLEERIASYDNREPTYPKP